MKKRILGIIIAGVLALTTVPFVSASATEIKTTNEISSISRKSNFSDGFVYKGTVLYSQPYSDCAVATLSKNTPAQVRRYDGEWFQVKIQGNTYYVWGSYSVYY